MRAGCGSQMHHQATRLAMAKILQAAAYSLPRALQRELLVISWVLPAPPPQMLAVLLHWLTLQTSPHPQVRTALHALGVLAKYRAIVDRRR